MISKTTKKVCLFARGLLVCLVIKVRFTFFRRQMTCNYAITEFLIYSVIYVDILATLLLRNSQQI